MKKIITHNGRFHADEIFAVATIMLAFPEEKFDVVRTRDEENIKTADFVLDVGGIHDTSKNRFDHHQTGKAGIRENGIYYASFGLVWNKFGEKVSESLEVSKKVEERLVVPIDANDNGIKISTSSINPIQDYTISDMIASFVPTNFESSLLLGQHFSYLVTVAKEIIKREVNLAQAQIAEEKIIEKAYSDSIDKKIIVLPQRCSSVSENIFVDKETLVFIYQGLEGNWHAICTRKSYNSFDCKIYFPEGWGGLRDKDFIEKSGVKDAVFCHTVRHLSVAKSKEGAIEMAKIAVREMNIK